MKRFIKSIFHKAGFEIRKLPDFKSDFSPKNNLIVEFIGAPCIGKSTHLERLEKHTTTSFYNGNTFGFFDPVDKNLKDYHLITFQERVKHLIEQGFKNYNFFNNLRYYINQINNDTKYLSVEGCVITEEGLFHTFTREFKELAKNNTEIFKSALENRAFIHIKGSPEKIYNQIIGRYNESGRLLPEHNTSKENLIEMSKKAVAAKSELIKIIKSFDNPCLELDIENGIENNVRLIDSFIYKQLKK